MEMEKKKKDYEAPDIEVTQVEVESSICNGSVEPEVQTTEGTSTVSQDVSTGFETENNFGSGSWDNQKTN